MLIIAIWNNKKKEISLDEYCNKIYDDLFFLSSSSNIPNVNKTYYNVVLNSLIESDDLFSKIEYNIFETEIINLRLEIFSYAFLNKYGLRASAGQTTYTKQFLEDKELLHIWEGSGIYSDSIPKSLGLFIDKNNRKEVEKVLKTNESKRNLFNELIQEGIHPDTVSRMLCRVYTEKVWKDGKVLLAWVFDFLKQIGFDPATDFYPNMEAATRLGVVFKGFYDGYYQDMDNIKIVLL